jgi:hypothetical protein
MNTNPTATIASNPNIAKMRDRLHLSFDWSVVDEIQRCAWVSALAETGTSHGLSAEEAHEVLVMTTARKMSNIVDQLRF